MTEHLEQLIVTAPKIRQLVFAQPGKAVLETGKLSKTGERDVLVKTLFSGISRGTESLVFNGKVPESQWQAMRCPHQTGEFSFPLTYGYSLAGKVVDTGSGVKCFQKGDTVFCLHPHQDMVCLEESCFIRIPDNIPASRAVLAANMETALNAVWDSGLQKNESCAVIGAGIVGLLTAFLAKQVTGKVPLIADINPERNTPARKLGLEFCPADKVENSGGPGFDCIYNTSGSASGLQSAIDAAGFEGRIIEMSWFGNKQVTLGLGGNFHSGRLKIIASQVGHVSPEKRASTSRKTRLEQAMMNLDDPVFDHLLEPPIAFNELPSHLPGILGEKAGVLCQLVKYADN